MELVDVRVCVIGEGMLELSREAGVWRLGYGGDMLNTAIHCARFGHDTGFLTALGTDPFSVELGSGWAAEGLDPAMILSDQARTAGLYAITTDEAGERSFTYWRSDSAARNMFALPDIDAALSAASRADVLVFSLITLAILPAEARDRLFALCAAVRARGGNVAFDGNYRPRLWPSAEAAATARDAAIAHADIGLPTLDDEILLGAEASAEAVRNHWQALGCAETVVKLGPAGCRIPDGTTIAPPVQLVPVDTSGAGDAFDAAYLNARLGGATITDAARAGHRLAGWVITQHGAIPARTAAAPYC